MGSGGPLACSENVLLDPVLSQLDSIHMFSPCSFKIMRGGMKVMPPVFFPENVIAITMKFVWMIYPSFAIMR
jgi:hypothetical protein